MHRDVIDNTPLADTLCSHLKREKKIILVGSSSAVCTNKFTNDSGFYFLEFCLLFH